MDLSSETLALYLTVNWFGDPMKEMNFIDKYDPEEDCQKRGRTSDGLRMVSKSSVLLKPSNKHLYKWIQKKQLWKLRTRKILVDAKAMPQHLHGSGIEDESGLFC